MKKLYQSKSLFTHAAVAAFVFAATMATAIVSNAAGDVAAGEKVFKKCKQCHMIGDGAKSRQGPILTGIIDRPAGTIEGFRYSKGMKTKAEEGLVWTEENIAEYLKSPRKFIPKGKMSFAGLKKEEQITDLIAYIRTFQP